MLHALPDPEKAQSTRSANEHAAAQLSTVESTPESDPNIGGFDGEDEFGLEDDAEDADSVRSRNGHRGANLSRFNSTTDSLLRHRAHPIIPRWLLWLKDVFFAANDHHADIPTYRYLPFVSGAFIPFSILLEIPGITERWYVRKENGIVVESRNNTVLLNVVMGISLASACVANGSLLLRFFERRVAAMTILCLLFLTVHDIINIIVIIVFGVQHRFNDGFTYGESYWLTVCSTIVSLITNGTLIWDLVRTPNFAKSGSGLTRKQRSLVIINIIFLAYTALGALAFRYLIGLSFIDSLYFTVVTTLTIGFGDIDATTGAQRSVLCLYSAFGIIILGAAVRLIGETVIEALEVGYRKRVRDYRKHRHERQRHVREAARWRNAVEARLKAKGAEIWMSAKDGEVVSIDGLPRSTAPAAHPLRHGRNPARPGLDKPVPKAFRQESDRSTSELPPHDPDTEDRLRPPPRAGMVLNTAALSMAELAAAAREAHVAIERFAPEALEHTQSSGRKAREPTAGDPRGVNWWANTYHWLLAAKGAHPEDEHAQIGKVYVDTVHALEVDERRSLYVKLGVAWSSFILFWMVGSLIFWHVEGWPYGDAMYFCFVTFTTVGYGDVTPVTALGRSIFVFWALLGVGSMTVLIAVISDAFSSKYRSVMHSKTFDRAVEHYRAGNSSNAKVDGPSPESNPGTPSNDMREHIPNQLKKDLDRLAAPEGFTLRRRTTAQQEAEDEKHTTQTSQPSQPTPQDGSLERRDSARSQSQTSHPTPPQPASHDHPNEYPSLVSALHPQPPPHNQPSDPPSPTHQRHAELTTRLRSRFEALPPSILEEAHTLREQMRFFLTSNGHAHGLDDTAPNTDDKVPRSLRELFDEISKDDPGDGSQFGDRMKAEIWEDDYARNTLFVLGFEKSIRKLVDVAEGALEVLAERDRLLAENQAQRAAHRRSGSPGRSEKGHELVAHASEMPPGQ